jgi:hypothetical protein
VVLGPARHTTSPPCTAVTGDTRKHRLLIGVSGSIGAYARGLRRAMEDAA